MSTLVTYTTVLYNAYNIGMTEERAFLIDTRLVFFTLCLVRADVLQKG